MMRGMNEGRPSVATEEVLAEAVQRLKKVCPVDRVSLFGSVARGDAGPDSDFDFLLVVPDGLAPLSEAWARAYEALCSLRIPVDIQLWPRSLFERQLRLRASLPATVLREGKLLYAA